MAKHFDPQKDAEKLKETYDTVKIKVVTTVDGKKFVEKFGFDRRQYPDGSWTDHVDLAIEKAKEHGLFADSKESSSS